MQSRGVFWRTPGPFGDHFPRQSIEIGAAEDPGAIGKRVDGVDLTTFSCQPECLGANAEMGSCLREVEPELDPIRGRPGLASV
jgi:hypothetical protein